MFMITKNWLMIPQFLYYILMATGGLLTIVSTGLIVWGILQKRKKSYFAFWSAALFIGVLLVILTTFQKIVGHMMVGGSVGI